MRCQPRAVSAQRGLPDYFKKVPIWQDEGSHLPRIVVGYHAWGTKQSEAKGSKGRGWMERFWGAKASLMMEVVGGLKPDEQRVAEKIFKQVSETLERRRFHSGS